LVAECSKKSSICKGKDSLENKKVTLTSDDAGSLFSMSGLSDFAPLQDKSHCPTTNISRLPGVLQRGLGGSEPCDGHAEGGAGNVGQTHVVAELHSGGVAALLAADTQLDVRAGLAVQIARHLGQAAYADLCQ